MAVTPHSLSPLVSRDLGLTDTQLGLVLAIFIWPYAIAHPAAGWLVDRFGSRLLMALAVGTWTVVSALTGLARGLGSLTTLRALLGLAETPMLPAAFKSTVEWFVERERAFAVSVYIAGCQIGLAVAPPVATALVLAFGWRIMFALTGAIGLVVLVGWLVAARRAPVTMAAARPAERAARARRARERPTGRQWRALLRRPAVWASVLGSFGLQYGFWFYITWLPTYLERTHHVTIGKAGFLSVLPYVAAAVGVLLGGRLSDLVLRAGRPPMLARRVVVTGSAVVMGAALLVTAFTTSTGPAVVLLTLGMFSYGVAQAPYWALASELVVGSQLQASMGSLQNLGSLAGGVAPLVTGMLVGGAGGFGAALTVAGLLVLVAAAMYGLVLRRPLDLPAARS
jgi:MFS family permease